MRIRALTGFIDPGWPIETEFVAKTAQCLKGCRSALQDAGFEVQTLRIATPPPSEMSTPVAPADRPDLARRLEAEIFIQGIDYAAIGPALPNEPDGYRILPEVLDATDTVFSSGLYADPTVGLSLTAARACAQAIQEISTIRDDGFGNLRFAALVNVPSGVPFFPAAYHRGGPPSLAIATESADLAVGIVNDASSTQLAKKQLIAAIETSAANLTRVAGAIARDHGFRFLGVDFSFAPYPEVQRSIGTALETIGASTFGQSGSAVAAAFLTDCLDRAQFQRVGFCGLFLPVLEDTVLASRASEGILTISDLLLYSTLCGTGLDTIPLPGDASIEALTGLLLDLGAIGLRHTKPLTARLMPIPGKIAGDTVHFDFPYFADSRVLPLSDAPLSGLLERSGTLDIGPHNFE
ncbi:MAG: DUF711 family protein [Anaerolineales bacterium]